MTRVKGAYSERRKYLNPSGAGVTVLHTENQDQERRTRVSAPHNASPTQVLPRVVHGIGHHLFTVGSDVHRKLDRLGVALLELLRLLGELPVRPAIEVLDHAHRGR